MSVVVVAVLFDHTRPSKTHQHPSYTLLTPQVSWHPSGKYFFTASADKTCKIFEADSGKVVQTFALPDKTVDYMQMGCAYVGERPVSVSFNGDVNIFDAAKEAPTAVLRGHVKPVTALAVDGDVVVTGSSDPSILIWDSQAHDPTKSRRPKAKKMHSSVVSCATTHKGKLYTAGMDDTIAVTDLATNELSIIGKVSGGPNGLCVLQDHLVVSTNKGVYVLGLDGEEKSKLSTTWTPTCAATNGQVLAVGSKPKLFLFALKGGKLTELEVADHHKDKQITALAWSKDGSRLASGDAGREILVWEFDGKLKVLSGPGQMAFHTAGIKSLAFNPSGSHIASASIDTNVIAWSTAALGAKKVKVSQAHLGGVNVVDWLSDKEIVTGGQVWHRGRRGACLPKHSHTGLRDPHLPSQGVRWTNERKRSANVCANRENGKEEEKKRGCFDFYFAVVLYFTLFLLFFFDFFFSSYFMLLFLIVFCPCHPFS